MTNININNLIQEARTVQNRIADSMKLKQNATNEYLVAEVDTTIAKLETEINSIKKQLNCYNIYYTDSRKSKNLSSVFLEIDLNSDNYYIYKSY